MIKRYHVYKTGGSYVGPAHGLYAALKAIMALKETVNPGEPYATLYRENELGARVMIKSYYRPRSDPDVEPV